MPMFGAHRHSGHRMLVDCHTHLNRYGPDAPATLAERYAQLRAAMDENGVDYALVLSSYLVNDDRPSARAITRLADEDPRIGVVAGWRYGAERAAELEELQALLQERRIKGIKLYPGYEPFFVHDPAVYGVYALAREYRVPVVIHTGDTYSPHGRVKYAHPLEVDEVAVQFRDVTFVICHLGNPWFADTMEVVYKNPNVVTDISGLTLGAFDERFQPVLVRKVNEAIAYINDPDKLMFGSDWPIADVTSYVRFVQQLDLTEAEREGLMWRNAARVFGIDEAVLHHADEQGRHA